ncbi:MAG: type II toxin-antitoxin system RatA family toxin [Gammaproteobacteria bacterium]|nr:type II toxin-antitoxin system RatA family toxin [Gammaproteobacteria bacterium]MBT4462086.1 type II toxin-antitoxin system RatA family toxin [Gammaproteobacteria bacterium]MBT4654945.1 type II toxin-antitoxin system RatA family toxin [Gammaproteobacteria bacterium]MBT5116565.1 type II toxin-antitoxin system RatA family toxin [Gammaproteobacteria bacterium]MBT5761570.1 type II toxin-antitoxin system RatA family toxin [Gammaproteobacteria bacterium]
MNYINKSEEINVDYKLIFSLINNVADYHKFLPWCSDSKIILDDGSKMSAEIEIAKNFVSWKFSTENTYDLNKKINIKLIDGPFNHLEGHWDFKKIDNYNTIVDLYLEYKFDSKIIELSIKPIFSNIMSSILDSFISEAFKRKGLS